MLQSLTLQIREQSRSERIEVMNPAHRPIQLDDGIRIVFRKRRQPTGLFLRTLAFRHIKDRADDALDLALGHEGTPAKNHIGNRTILLDHIDLAISESLFLTNDSKELRTQGGVIFWR